MGRHAVNRSRTTISLVALGSAAALVAGILSVNGAATADAPKLSDNLVGNPDFETGNGGWNTQNSKAALTSGAGHDSRRAARITAMGERVTLVLNDSPNVVQDSKAGTTYVGSVWVRSDTPRTTVSLRFREVDGSGQVGKAQSDVVISDGAWHQLKAQYDSTGKDTQISVQVLTTNAARGVSISIDDVDVRKVLEDANSPSPDPSPSETKTPKPDPTPSESNTPKPDPTPTQTQTPSGPTLFGASVYTGDGTSFADALSKSNAAYGGLEVVRVFHPSLPTAWPGKAGTTGGPVVVSFKANPKDVLSGSLDSFFRSWFDNAPRDRDIFWTNYHEPEDQIESGAFTAAQYRDALTRLDSLADQAKNPHLKTTTIWMCYDLKKGSGRDWHDYYPGSDVVDVMGWDCYNRGTDATPYFSPASILDDLRLASESMGKPWGMAEYASKLAPGDDGSGRAQWLKDSAAYARAHDALWVNYFDNYGGAVANPEYRLLDAASRAAWKWAVSGS